MGLLFSESCRGAYLQCLLDSGVSRRFLSRSLIPIFPVRAGIRLCRMASSSGWKR